jgi:dipeptidyl aminopeptidase/acylaminoacyl peptidase
MRRLLLLSCVLWLIALASPLDSALQSKTPMTIDHLITAVRLSDPQISVDGRQIAFVRTATALETGRRNADIWVVPADGSAAPREWIGGEKSENWPRFTPDGKRMVFISNREGVPQVYVAGLDGRNVKQVTNLSGGIAGPLVISRDSRRVAFVSDVFPQCTNEECNRRTREALDQDPVKVRVLTRLPYRHWNEWRNNIRHHVFVAEIDNGETHDVTPGDFDSPPHFYENDAITFSPDGASVLFVSKREGPDREMWSTNMDVWMAPIAGGPARKVTPNPAADVQPVFSPDGKTLAVRAQRRPGFESDRWYIDLYNPDTGMKRTLFESPDLSVDDYVFSPDGRTIFFTAAENGSVNLYSIPLAGGAPKRIVRGGAVGGIQAAANFVVYALSSLTAPAELYRVTSNEGSTRVLTNENAGWLSRVEAPQPESRTTVGAAGASVQYWVLKPPRFDASKKYPAVFLIHGGPQSAFNDAWSYRWNPELWAAQGWVVVAPNPRGSFGFGQKFVDEISQDWCGKVMTDLNAVFDAVVKLPYVDAQRTGIAGASYGGYAVDWIIGHTNRFKAAVSHDGVFNLESMALETDELWFDEWEFGGLPWSPAARRNFQRCSPDLSADKITTPTLIITNEQDFRVPVDQGLQLFTALRRNGVPAEALVFPNEGHWVESALDSKRWHELVFGWMQKYLSR